MVNQEHRSWTKRLGYFFFILVLIPVCFEGALWILQYRPYQQKPYFIHAEPELAVIGHPSLGFALRPGVFDVTINEGLHYRATHGQDSLRITGLSPSDSLPEIWLFGCSYTYGMGVNDEETFAWRLQKSFPQFRIRNFGVPGYGTVQSLLQLSDLVHKMKRDSVTIPPTVILCYADFHDERNVLAPRYRHALSVGYRRADSSHNEAMHFSRIPFAESSSSVPVIQWATWDSLYQDWWGRDIFCSVNFWQTFSDNVHQADLDPDGVTRRLTLEMQELCDSIHAPFFVAGLTGGEETNLMLESWRKLGIRTADISVNLAEPAYHHAPYDTHPNAWAHEAFAQGLEAFLKK